jgi:hypothetical protein
MLASVLVLMVLAAGLVVVWFAWWLVADVFSRTPSLAAPTIARSRQNKPRPAA